MRRADTAVARRDNLDEIWGKQFEHMRGTFLSQQYRQKFEKFLEKKKRFNQKSSFMIRPIFSSFQIFFFRTQFGVPYIFLWKNIFPQKSTISIFQGKLKKNVATFFFGSKILYNIR